jgi:hypothetical protein
MFTHGSSLRKPLTVSKSSTQTIDDNPIANLVKKVVRNRRVLSTRTKQPEAAAIQRAK